VKILFVDGTPNHNPKERKSRPTGGILNSLTLIPEYLAKQGHEVYVNSTYQVAEVINGVHYVKDGDEIPKVDIAVFNRNILPREQVGYWKEKGTKIVWWLHDIVQLSYLKDDTYQYVDKIIALSEYCKDTYSNFYSLDANKFTVIPNGVDKELFYPGTAEQRNPHMMLMASALVKGFLPIPTVFENLQRHNSDIDFRIYSSQTLHGIPNSPDQQRFLNKMEMVGAHVYSPVSQESLAILLRQARCLLMPNTYPEICSNLLLQAQASGCPVVTSDIGSAPEFIQDGVTGLMTTKYKPHDMFSWIVEYTNKVLDVYLQDKLFNKISAEETRAVKDWNDIGGMWNVELSKMVV
jgi:glycosyltransferase involved in cell wall biosynthesis